MLATTLKCGCLIPKLVLLWHQAQAGPALYSAIYEETMFYVNQLLELAFGQEGSLTNSQALLALCDL